MIQIRFKMVPKWSKLFKIVKNGPNEPIGPKRSYFFNLKSIFRINDGSKAESLSHFLAQCWTQLPLQQSTIRWRSRWWYHQNVSFDDPTFEKILFSENLKFSESQIFSKFNLISFSDLTSFGMQHQKSLISTITKKCRSLLKDSWNMKANTFMKPR